MQPDEAAELMRENFVDKVDIPENFNYVSTEKMREHYDLNLDGYTFISDEYLVLVDCRHLPDNITVAALEPGEGEITSVDTYLSGEAARTANHYMRQDFDYKPQHPL